MRDADAVRAWATYNAARLDFAERHRERYLIVHVAAVANAPNTVIERVNDMLGGSGDARLAPDDGTAPIDPLLMVVPETNSRAERAPPAAGSRWNVPAEELGHERRARRAALEEQFAAMRSAAARGARATAAEKPSRRARAP